MKKKTNFYGFLSFANYIADVVAVELIKSYKLEKNIFTKKNGSKSQVVTKIDNKIELMVRKLINLEFPTHNIIGEEYSAEKKTQMQFRLVT